MRKNNAISKIGFFVKDFFTHWNTPPRGDYYLPNKEFIAYSVGGMGVQGMGILTQYTAITMGAYLSVTYGFDQQIVLYTTWVMSILSIFRAPIIGWLIDNTNTRWGRYRPYLLWGGVGSTVCMWLLAIIPDMFMGTQGSEWTVVISYQIIYFIAMTVYSLFSYGRIGLSQVITPNTSERTKLYSVGGVIDSLGPSVVQLFFPLITNAFYGPDGIYPGTAMTDIRTYQIILPIFGMICSGVALIMFMGCKERFILKKNEKKRIGFLAGIRKSFGNKYFWLVNISNVLAFGRITIFASSIYIATYLIGGQLGTNVFSVMSTVLGIAFVPGMLLSPIIVKKIGKRNMTILAFAGSGSLSALMLIFILLGYESAVTPAVLYIGIFLHNIFQALFTVSSPAMAADYCEYQQWKTGDRLDGFMSQFSTVITTFAGLATSALVTEILISAGAENANDYANPTVMHNVFIIWAVMGIVCGILAILPYLFWDLSEYKQRGISRELKRSAYIADIKEGNFEAKNLSDALNVGAITLTQAYEMGLVSQEESMVKGEELSFEVKSADEDPAAAYYK